MHIISATFLNEWIFKVIYDVNPLFSQLMFWRYVLLWIRMAALAWELPMDFIIFQNCCYSHISWKEKKREEFNLDLSIPHVKLACIYRSYKWVVSSSNKADCNYVFGFHSNSPAFWYPSPTPNHASLTYLSFLVLV